MPFSHVLLALCVIAIWGINFVVIQIGLRELPPIFLTFLRFFFAAFPAVFFIKRPQIPFKMLFSYAMLMFTLDFAFLFSGMYAGVSSGIASLTLQTQVFFTAILAMIFLKEKLTPWQILGALVAFCGIGLVAINTGGDVNTLGLLLVEFAALSWAGGNLVSKKIGKVDMFSLVVWGSLVAWPPLLLLSFILEYGQWSVESILNVSWLTIGSVAYLVYPVTLFGFAIWSWLLSRHAASTVAPFTLLVPIFGFSSSALILGEGMQGWKIGAGFLIVFGLVINLYGGRLFAFLHTLFSNTQGEK